MPTFAAPDRWIWVFAALPILAFFLLKTRPRQRPVATLLFWEQVFQEKRSRRMGRRLRHVFSLLLQLLILGLVVWTLLDPLWSSAERTQRQRVLVLDASASMQAMEGEGSRFQQAVARAAEEVAAMRAGDELALVLATSPPQVIVGMTDFAPTIGEALKKQRVTDSPADLAFAVETARKLITNKQGRDIVVITDACGPLETIEQLNRASDVLLRTVGSRQDNVAITRFQTRRSFVDPIGYTTLIEVESFRSDDTIVECRLTLERDGQLVDVLPLELQPRVPWRKNLEFASAAGGVLVATIDTDDALACDNVARAVLPARDRIPVNLVSEQPDVYLTGALQAIPLVDLTASEQPLPTPPLNGLTVLYRTVPDPLPAGPLLVIDPPSDSPYWSLTPPVTAPVMAPPKILHPLLHHVRLQNVSLPAARGLELQENGVPLITTTDEATVMAAIETGGDGVARRRIVVLSTPLLDSDLPLRIAFPVLMANAVNWFSNTNTELQPAVATGQSTRWPLRELDSENSTWRLTQIDQQAAGNNALRREQRLVADRQGLRLGPLTETGLYAIQQVRDGEVGASRQLAVNLSNRKESDLRPVAAVQLLNESRIDHSGPPLRIYGMLLAFGLLLGEWFLFQRKIVD